MTCWNEPGLFAGDPTFARLFPAAQRSLARRCSLKDDGASGQAARIRILAEVVREIHTEIDELETRYRAFQDSWSEAGTLRAQATLLAGFLRRAGRDRATPRRVRRYLDLQAAEEARLLRLGRLEAELQGTTLMLAALAEGAPGDPEALAVLTELLEQGLLETMARRGGQPVRWQLRAAVHGTLARIAMVGTPADRHRWAGRYRDSLLRDLENPAPWVRPAALEALMRLEPEKAPQAAGQFLALRGAATQDPFLRSHLLTRLPELLPEGERDPLLIRTLSEPEPSQLVQQTALDLAAQLGLDPGPELLERYLAMDSHQVRAYALVLALVLAVQGPDGPAAELLGQALDREQDRLCLLLLLERVEEMARGEIPPEKLTPVVQRLEPRWSQGEIAVRLRRVRLLLSVLSDPEDARRWRALTRHCESWLEGHREILPAELVPEEPWRLGRLLSLLAQSGFGFEFDYRRGGVHVRHGDLYRPMLWRILHEIRRPGPDRRVAYPHHVGRSPHLPHRVPPALLGETTPTKVPGERLHHRDLGGWRPEIPLLDDFLSLVARPWSPDSALLYTPAGITELTTESRSILQWARLYWSLSRRFATIARLRNAGPWDPVHRDPEAYRRTLEELGFHWTLRPYPEVRP